jgi:hypothetical protein
MITQVLCHFKWQRRLLLKLLGLALAVGAFLYCRHFSDDAGVTLYVEAARCMLHGKPLQTCNPFYTYPPIVAFLTIPLVSLPLVLQNIVWYALTIGGLFWGLLLIVPLAQRVSRGSWSMRELLLLQGVGIVISLKFVFAAIANQNYDVLVVLFVLSGLTNLAKGWPNGQSSASLWAGLSFGCRVYNRRFLQMCSHYLVEPAACTPASDWEKGQVENQVGLVRERFFTPRLRFKTSIEMNAWLLDKCMNQLLCVCEGFHCLSSTMCAPEKIPQQKTQTKREF